MTKAVTLKRPKQFLLHLLVWQDFEDLVRDLGLRVLGSGLTGFKAGADGGRDARFDGTPNGWPSSSAPEQGQYILQCKHTGKAGACCSEEDFKKLLRKEVPKVKALVAAQEMSHYMVFTNRTAPAAEDVAFRSRFGKIAGLSKSWLLGNESMSLLLREHGDIWDRYEEEIRNPIRFNRDDLIQIINDFADFVKRGEGQPRSKTIQHIKLEEKNRLNGISEPYFADVQRYSMPQFEQIRMFLENPRNEEALDLYTDTADDLRGRLRNMLSERTITRLEEGFDQIRDEFISSDDALKRKRRYIRVFINYMYCTCDIGQNVDAPQTSQA